MQEGNDVDDDADILDNFCKTLGNCFDTLLDPKKIRIFEPSFVIDMRTFPNFTTANENVIESGIVQHIFFVSFIHTGYFLYKRTPNYEMINYHTSFR